MIHLRSIPCIWHQGRPGKRDQQLSNKLILLWHTELWRLEELDRERDCETGRWCNRTHFEPLYLAILISLSLFCCQIKLYSLFTKKYIISRTTKIQGTFKFLTFYQTCNKVQSVFCYIIYLSHSLFHGQALLTFTILYVTTKLIC
jgi:hypothetical protein